MGFRELLRGHERKLSPLVVGYYGLEWGIGIQLKHRISSLESDRLCFRSQIGDSWAVCILASYLPLSRSPHLS